MSDATRLTQDLVFFYIFEKLEALENSFILQGLSRAFTALDELGELNLLELVTDQTWILLTHSFDTV